MNYEAFRKHVDELGGTAVVQVKLGAIFETLEALEHGDIQHAISKLSLMAAVDDRKNLRRVRDEVYRRYKHALQVGDRTAAVELEKQLSMLKDAKSSLTA